MPRQRGGRPAAKPMGRSFSPASRPAPSQSRGYSTSAAPSSTPSHQSAPPPAPSPGYAPAPAPSSGGGMMSGIMGTVAQGMALGTGSAIAHRAVDSAWGAMTGGASSGHMEPAQVQAGAAQMQQADHPCAAAAKQFADCMSNNGGDMASCEFVFNAMQQCKMAHP